MLIFWWKKNGI